MTPLERLLAEGIPTRPDPPTNQPWTAEEQQRHLADHERQTRAHNRQQKATEAA